MSCLITEGYMKEVSAFFKFFAFDPKKNPFKYIEHHQGYSRPPDHRMHLFLDLRFGNLKAKGLFAQTFKSWFQLVVKDCPCNTLHRMISTL